MNNSQPEHFESVHLLRGIAAMLVLMAHSFRSFYFWDVPWFEKSVFDAGQIGVSVFFVISGFVLPLSLQNNYRFADYPRFLLRRFVRIEPTYLASMVVAIAWVWTATRLAPNAKPWEFDFGQIAAHLLYFVPFTDYKWVNEVYWTLAIEFQFYLFIGAGFCLFRKSAEKAVFASAALILLLAGVTFLSPLCSPIRLIHYAPFFGIGMLAWLASCYRVKFEATLVFLGVLVGIGFFGGLSFSNLLFGAMAFYLILYWKPQRTWCRFFWHDFVFPLCDSPALCRTGTCDRVASCRDGLQAVSFCFANGNDGCLYLGGVDSLQTCRGANDEAFEEDEVLSLRSMAAPSEIKIHDSTGRMSEEARCARR